MRRFLVPVFAVLVLSVAPRCWADTITFDSVPALPGNNTSFGTLITQGFVFTSPHAHVITSPPTCVTGCADNGTPWIGGDTTSIRMSRSIPFSLSTFDAAEAFTGLIQPSLLTITGTFTDGSTRHNTYAFDGVNDSSGPARDFQSFAANYDWYGLTSVEFSAGEGFFGIDNITVGPATPTPEPATLLLIGVGLAGCAKRAAERRKQT